MSEMLDVSVIISTHNRCRMLPEALDSVLRQDAGAVRYEVIVVDNNSTDATRTVVEGFTGHGVRSLQYVFEPEQGLSHARNAGIRHAHAPVLAFTDDDVRAAPDWVRQIKRGFDRYPEAAFVGGKVLPRWGREPPAWLTNEHWAPLALLDYGDEPLCVDAERMWCLVGANLAVRREVFGRVGHFAPESVRSQDHEWELRVWRAGLQGMYIPEALIYAEVQPERLAKAHHRRWHTTNGELVASFILHKTP